MHPDVVAIWAKTKEREGGGGERFMYFGYMSSLVNYCSPKFIFSA